MTAVEQFIEQLEQQGDSWENVSMGTINISIKVEDYLELQRQCKEMEKQQIIDARVDGHISTYTEYAEFPKCYLDGGHEQYYKETFKSE